MARISALPAILFASALIGLAGPADAALISASYGDDDGFGIGATSGTLNANVSHASPGEAAGTDVRRIGTGFAVGGAFQPTGGFVYSISSGATIGSATLTMRLGAFTPTNPVSGPNLLRLDGTDFSSFIASFTANVPNGAGNRIQTLTFTLPSTFYASLLDGTVSLLGTRISEGAGRGSFQVDFLRINIVTVPEAPSLALLGAGLLGLGLVVRRREAASLSMGRALP